MKKRRQQVGARVKEEPDIGYQARRRLETSNLERRTSNAELGNREAEAARAKRYDLEDRLLEYAVRIIRLADALPATRAGRHIADQLLRYGTSPLANHGELQGAESRKDFIHKLGICLKEIREAQRWLRLIDKVPLVAPPKISPLLTETDALIRIFVASLRTSEKNR
jgi:four helix bundle protein